MSLLEVRGIMGVVDVASRGGHSQIRMPTKLRDAIGRSLDLDDVGEDVE